MLLARHVMFCQKRYTGYVSEAGSLPKKQGVRPVRVAVAAFEEFFGVS